MRAHIYTDLAPALHAGAELSILGSLHYLIEQTRVTADSEPVAEATFHPAG